MQRGNANHQNQDGSENGILNAILWCCMTGNMDIAILKKKKLNQNNQ